MKKTALAALLLTPAFAAAAPLPEAVAHELETLAYVCRLSSGRPYGFRHAVEQADLNGDGIDDYVVDDGELQCYGGSGIFGSRQGGGVSVFVGRAGGGAEKSFFHGAFGSRIDYTGRHATAYLGVAGALCGQRREDEERYGYEKCSRPLKWNAQARRFEIDTTVKRPVWYR